MLFSHIVTCYITTYNLKLGVIKNTGGGGGGAKQNRSDFLKNFLDTKIGNRFKTSYAMALQFNVFLQTMKVECPLMWGKTLAIIYRPKYQKEQSQRSKRTPPLQKFKGITNSRHYFLNITIPVSLSKTRFQFLGFSSFGRYPKI